MKDLKSMPVFFADNKDLLCENAKLIENLVIGKVAPDRFPTSVNIASGTVAGWDGFAYMVAVSLRIVVFIFDGKSPQDFGEISHIMKSTKPKDWPEWIHTYQVDCLGLLQSVVLHHTGKDGGGVPDVFGLLDQVGEHHPQHASVLATALKKFMLDPKVDGLSGRDAFTLCDHMLTSVDRS